MNEIMIRLVDDLFVDMGITLCFFGAIISFGFLLGTTAIALGYRIEKKRQAKLAKNK